MPFEAVKQAIVDLETAENTWESKGAANSTAQAALVNAQSAASQASSDLSTAVSDVTAKAEAAKKAIADFEQSLGVIVTV